MYRLEALEPDKTNKTNVNTCKPECKQPDKQTSSTNIIAHAQSVPREGMPPASANHEVKDVTILLMYNMSLGFGLLTFTLSHGQSYPSLSLMEMKRWWADFSFAIYSYFFEIQYHVRMSFCNFSPTCLVGQSTSSLAFQNNESSVAFQNQ